MAYLRFRLFYALLKPFSGYARKRRTEKFVRLMAPRDGLRVLDLGGQPEIWDGVGARLNITILNLPGIANSQHRSHHQISYVEGDACNMPEYQSGDFDLVFSNSVIEHVGSTEKRTMFAREVRRLNAPFWVQTPYKYYPIEAHCGMPFWWLYPKSWRDYFLNRWRRQLPAWTDMVEGTDIVSVQEIKSLFPTATVFKEWLIFPKSVVAYSKA